MPYKKWNNILKKISHDPSLSGENVIEKIKEKLQSHPAAYKEWGKENFSLGYPFSCELVQHIFKVTLLHYAARKGYVKLVEALLEAKEININATNHDGWTALHYAVVEGHTDVAKLLLKKGADIDAKTNNSTLTTLSLIIFLNDQRCGEKVKFLLANDANVNAVNCNGEAPLHFAAEKGSVEVVTLLLAKGADVSAVNCNGEAPLHFAAEKGSVEVVTLLLAKGADVSAADKHGQTPLHYASDKGHIKVVEALLKNGANVINAVNRFEETPLHLAARGGHIEVVKHLLENGADINIVDKCGDTPLHNAALHRAAREGHIKVVEALLEEGANPTNVLNSYFYEKNHVNPKIKEHLKEAKEKINRSASDLFGAGCANKQKEAEKIIEFSKQEGRLAAILESSSWMKCLFISKEKAKELAKKDNKDIIREIQTRQAIGLGIVGGMMAVFAIIAIATIIFTASIPMTPGVITGIVASGVLGSVGLLGVGFACYHVPKEPPSAEMNEVGNKLHVPKSEPKKGAAPDVPSA